VISQAGTHNHRGVCYEVATAGVAIMRNAAARSNTTSLAFSAVIFERT